MTEPPFVSCVVPVGRMQCMKPINIILGGNSCIVHYAEELVRADPHDVKTAHVPEIEFFTVCHFKLSDQKLGFICWQCGSGVFD